jgi:hypothetical protein
VPEPETFAEFKNSFSYGSRTDLAFKFLKMLPEDEAAEFLRLLLEGLGQTIDDGDAGRLVDLAYRWQVRGYTPPADAVRPWTYDDGPFAAMRLPVAEARVGLVTSSGHFLAGDDPQPFGVVDMTQEEATARISEFLRTVPELSEIPSGTPTADLQVRHGGYDIRGAFADPDVAFPLATMRALSDDGVIGELAPTAFSFVGATAQRRLLKEAAPAWADRLVADGVDAVVLVPL